MVTESTTSFDNEHANNLRAIFEILAYLHVDAQKDGEDELADRLDFAMKYTERKIKELKQAQTVPPVSSGTGGNA